MTSYRTPKARLGRTGKWALGLIAAAVLLAFLAVLPILTPVQAATTASMKQDLAAKQAALEQAYAKLDALQDELNKLAEAFDAAETRGGELEGEIGQVELKIRSSERQLQAARLQLEERLVSIYKDGGSTSYYLDVFFSEDDLVSVFERLDALNRIAEDDQELFAKVEGYLAEAKANKALLEEKKAEQAERSRDLLRLRDETSSRLKTASAEYQGMKAQIETLQAEIRRADARAAALAAQRRAAALRAKAAEARKNSGSGSSGGTVQPGAFTFPVRGAHSYVNTWGASRSGGRTHKGIDIMASRGTALVACVSGTVTKVNPYDTGDGGRTLYIRGANGTVYYYAHMDSIASGIRAGTYVTAGKVVGTVGSTGNASANAPHLHFGMIVNGVYVNPYATLRASGG